MPSVVPLPEFLTSRRHLAAAGVGLAVVVALTGAATFAPGPSAARTVAAPAAPTFVIGALDADADADADAPTDVPTAVGTATTTLPPATAATAATTKPSGPAITALAAQGIPIVALEAYRKAAAIQAVARPTCRLAWTLVAAIGAVESGHGTHAGARLYADGQDLPHVIGPVLDGTAGNARIADTDNGVLDGDPTFDRAVGPMQFIPSTWARIGRDGNGDGRVDPFNIVDAAASTGEYLCRAGGDLATGAGRTVAVFSYNHLDSYVATVLAIDAAYAGRPVVVTSPAPPAAPATPTAPTSRPASPAPTRGPTSTPTRPATTAPPSTPPTSPSCPPTATGSATPTGTPTGTPTVTPTGSPSATPTGCPTGSSPPGTGTASSPASSSSSVSSSVVPSPSATPRATP